MYGGEVKHFRMEKLDLHDITHSAHLHPGALAKSYSVGASGDIPASVRARYSTQVKWAGSFILNFRLSDSIRAL